MQETFKKHIFVNILCGGGGTRLWPRSRRKTPKQFINLFGKESIFKKTVERAAKLASADKIFVTTNSDYVDEVLNQGKIIQPRNIVAEPQAKDTALAMGVGSIFIQKRDPQAIVVNLASDHLIDPVEEFVKEMTIAAKVAASGDFIITVGIIPTFPHTGYGYIKAGEKFKKVDGATVYKVLGFTEKPNLKKARQFLKEGKYFWNANLYTWSVASMMATFKGHAPKIAKLLERADEAIGTEKESTVLRQVYQEAEKISIDYAISEKAKNLLLVPGSFSWSDIGDWKTVYDLSPKDKEGNSIVVFGTGGEVMGFETKDCLIQTGKKFIGAIGVENLIIIDTPDALLVCNKDKAGDVKKLVNLLKEKGEKEYL